MEQDKINEEKKYKYDNYDIILNDEFLEIKNKYKELMDNRYDLIKSRNINKLSFKNNYDMNTKKRIDEINEDLYDNKSSINFIYNSIKQKINSIENDIKYQKINPNKINNVKDIIDKLDLICKEIKKIYINEEYVDYNTEANEIIEYIKELEDRYNEALQNNDVNEMNDIRSNIRDSQQNLYDLNYNFNNFKTKNNINDAFIDIYISKFAK